MVCNENIENKEYLDRKKMAWIKLFTEFSFEEKCFLLLNRHWEFLNTLQTSAVINFQKSL